MNELNNKLELARAKKVQFQETVVGDEWRSYRASQPVDLENPPETKVDRKILDEIINESTTIPDGFKPIRIIPKFLESRKKGYEADAFDWGTGEALAIGSLLKEGTPVRISGQDSQRGTFGHRMSVIHDLESGALYTPLNSLSNQKAKLEVINSPLSEYAVMGFEFGYSMVKPDVLTMWEAQFGDFVNGAQIIIDQFLSSSESKWGLCSGLVLLLPHGYEGQGPEHSSARIERFLQLAAEFNYFVVNPTTPAQIFHLLRRQVKQEFRKPLIVFTPKSLLRKKEAVSKVLELTDGRFEEILDDQSVDPKKVKRVLLCSGKVYYDLEEARAQNKAQDIAIVRLEQMYPLIEKRIHSLKEKYKKASDWVWVQEEPRNMGGWTYMATHFPDYGINLRVISRKESASPATGFSHRHKTEQQQIIDRAFEK